LRQDALDIPAVSLAVARLPFQRAGQFALIQPFQLNDPSGFGLVHAGRQFLQPRPFWKMSGVTANGRPIPELTQTRRRANLRPTPDPFAGMWVLPISLVI
jgi:hypothetical protein